MNRTLVILLFAFTTSLFAQSIDSVTAKIKFIPDTTFAHTDSILTKDSLLISIKPDSIAPIYSSLLTEKSLIIKNNELLKLDYKYTGEYLKLFPFNFIKDLGFTGQPNEAFLYGIGNNAISNLVDGVSINDRFSNSFNLNLFQSEDIDSIEIVPLPRGFLYGAYNNPVSINFITKDFITSQPYSRIRFYQSANRDMMFDGSFNAIAMKKLIASFSITNRITDALYDNTDYALWQGKFKLKYLLSNNINIIATYNYNDYKAGYSGGVDVDSIIRLGKNVNDVLYDFRAAPVIYPDGELKTLTHFPRLRFLIKPTEWLKTDANLFFMYSQKEQKDFASEYIENKTYGLNIRNDFDYSFFKFQLNVDYEKRNVFSNKSVYYSKDSIFFNAVQNDFDADLFSVSGVLSASLDDGTFIPSIYYKTSTYNKNYSQPMDYSDNRVSYGIGVDLLFKIKSSFGLYLGTSVLKPYNSSEQKYALIELGTKYQNQFIFADLKYFYNEYNYGFYTGGVFFDYIKFGNLSGLGLNLKFKYWKLLLESNSSYYFSIDDRLIGVPNFQTQTGLYYTNKLFSDNLDLKTGLVFYYTGTNNVFTDEHGVTEVPSSYKLDFTLAGEIQKTAIVYFTWQNLLNNNYYITPYYPMPTRTIRFGVMWEMFN